MSPFASFPCTQSGVAIPPSKFIMRSMTTVPQISIAMSICVRLQLTTMTTNLGWCLDWVAVRATILMVLFHVVQGWPRNSHRIPGLHCSRSQTCEKFRPWQLLCHPYGHPSECRWADVEWRKTADTASNTTCLCNRCPCKLQMELGLGVHEESWKCQHYSGCAR